MILNFHQMELDNKLKQSEEQKKSLISEHLEKQKVWKEKVEANCKKVRDRSATFREVSLAKVN